MSVKSVKMCDRVWRNVNFDNARITLTEIAVVLCL